MTNCYVYALFRPNGSPFYIGMGSRGRWNVHEKLARNGDDSHKSRLIRKIWEVGEEVQKEILEDGLSRTEAFDLERILISLVLREPNGPLINKVSGGLGGLDPSLETRRKMGEKAKKRMSQEEYKEKIRISNSNREWTKEMRERSAKQLSERNKKKVWTPEMREKIAESNRRRRGEKRNRSSDTYTRAPDGKFVKNDD